jgi:hypothetical protein
LRAVKVYCVIGRGLGWKEGAESSTLVLYELSLYINYLKRPTEERARKMKEEEEEEQGEGRRGGFTALPTRSCIVPIGL